MLSPLLNKSQQEKSWNFCFIFGYLSSVVWWQQFILCRTLLISQFQFFNFQFEGMTFEGILSVELSNHLLIGFWYYWQKLSVQLWIHSILKQRSCSFFFLSLWDSSNLQYFTVKFKIKSANFFSFIPWLLDFCRNKSWWNNQRC